MTKFLYALLALCCVMTVPQVIADTTVTVSGTVVLPPCEIVNGKTNDSTPISVDFGDVSIGKIDGVAYSQPVPWKISCQSAVNTNETVFELSLRAEPTDFDSGAFKTSVDGLGIRLMFGPLLMAPGSGGEGTSTPAWLGVNALAIKAVPVKKAGAELEAGTFTATASLILYYQ
ncbi:fimbrial protein [Pseudescherichia vulneris]